jgi:SAM-dependent methyltransferase
MTTLSRVSAHWETLAKEDPLWAVCTTADGAMDEDEFFATGRRQVESVLADAARLGCPPEGGRALDFGCGVGRLTRALSTRFDEVTGVDVSPEMVRRATEYHAQEERCRFLCNQADDLKVFPDGSFDLVFSSIVLQHLPTSLTKRYLAEFARVLRPSGVVIFDLPTRPKPTPRGIISGYAPPRAVGFAQKLLLGYPAPMEMHGMSRRRVTKLLDAAGVDVVAATDAVCCDFWYAARYFGRRRG